MATFDELMAEDDAARLAAARAEIAREKAEWDALPPAEQAQRIAEREAKYELAEQDAAESEIEPCVGCGDPDCDFDCDGDYDA